jgi:ubiquinone/menaquinone biosynthesis C-methylase UbiE
MDRNRKLTRRDAKPARRDTSWQNVAGWYNRAMGSRGSYFHSQIIMPSSVRLLGLKNGDKLLDLGCGQGVLTRHLPEGIKYTGVDLSPRLISEGKRMTPKKLNAEYFVADISGKLELNHDNFDAAAVILALQNIKDPEKVIANANRYLAKGGKLLLVLNHPAFRIPRQSGWGVNPENKTQYRWVNRYLSSLEVPINMHPGKGQRGDVTWSYHHSLQDYFAMLKKWDFAVTDLQEWASEKISQGKNKDRENTARGEIPVFMAIMAKKG